MPSCILLLHLYKRVENEKKKKEKKEPRARFFRERNCRHITRPNNPPSLALYLLVEPDSDEAGSLVLYSD